MKTLKKLTTMLLGVAFLCTLVLTPAMKSRADGVVTWYLTYSDGQWFASSNQINYWTGADFVASNIKDGDNLVINGSSAATELFSYKVDKKINELAVTGGASASVTAPYVERAYVAGKGSTLIVTADTVHFVEVYPAQTIQVIGNVIDLQAHYEYASSEHPVFAVTGTVTAANVAFGGNIANADTRIYGIGAGLIKSDSNGYVTLTEDQYSKTLTEPPKAGTKDTTADSSKKQLDKVPQTGLEVSQEVAIFGVLALIFASAAVMVGFASKNRD
ncbi:MAG: hypothetical protein J5626_02020 [Lachnospiraceae bacterium]|nr:hypothetical protein [Lachnospiraceae bacterium]